VYIRRGSALYICLGGEAARREEIEHCALQAVNETEAS